MDKNSPSTSSFLEDLDRTVPADSFNSSNVDQMHHDVVIEPDASVTFQDSQGRATLKRKLITGSEQADEASIIKRSTVEKPVAEISVPALSNTPTSSVAGGPSLVTSQHRVNQGPTVNPYPQRVSQHSSNDIISLHKKKIMPQFLKACGEKGDNLQTVKRLLHSLDGNVNVTGSYIFRTEQRSPKVATLEGVSPLFVAAANCNLKVVNYLLLKGAHVNFHTGIQTNINFSGKTPLFAAMFFGRKLEPSRRMPVIKLLLQNGADVFASTGGSIWTQETSSLIELTKIIAGIDSTTNLLDKVTALELTGAMVLLREEDATSVSHALQLWKQASRLRDQGSLPKVPLNSTNLIPWRHIEWITRSQLDDLLQRPAEMKIQAILVAHRIISNISPQAFFKCMWVRSVRSHCVALIKKKSFKELLEVCWSILEGVRHLLSKNLQSDDDLSLMTADVIGYLVNCLEKGHAFFTAEVLKLSMELVFDTIAVTRPDDSLRTIYDIVLILARNLQMVTNEMKDRLRKYVEQDGRDCSGYNLLLVACDRQSNDWTLLAVRLILEAGASSNSRNRNGNNPLHLFPQWMNLLATDSPILDVLLENGASKSQLNHAGQTPLDLWRERYPDMRRKAPFRCLTVTTVMPLLWWCVKKVRSDDTVEGSLSEDLRNFVLQQY